MMRFKVRQAKALKEMVNSISTISTQAFIAFEPVKFSPYCPDEVRISLSDENSELDALLIIIAKGFFDEYRCTKSLVIRVDLYQLSQILSSAENDDQVSVEFKEESPVSMLEIHICDLSSNEKQVEKLEAPKVLGDINLVHEETNCEWEAAIKSQHLENAVLHSAQIQQPLTITVTRTEFTLASRDESIQNSYQLSVEDFELDCKLENEPIHLELELSLYRHTGTFSLASSLSETVKLIFSKDTRASPLPSSFEFPISEFSKLCFYFRNVIFLRVLTAKMLKQMVTPTSTIADEALMKFSENEVVISAEHSETKINAVLKITAGFFDELLCRRLLVLAVDLQKLASILSPLEDDDPVCIFVKDENPITHLVLHTRNSRNNNNVIAEVKALESVGNKLDNDESPYKYEVGMSPLLFQNIVAHSATFEQPIDVNVTGVSVTLTTGSETSILSKENESECQMDEVPSSTQSHLKLPLHPIAEAVITACGMTDTVKLRESDGMSSGPPISLEFPIGPPLSKLLLHFPYRYCNM